MGAEDRRPGGVPGAAATTHYIIVCVDFLVPPRLPPLFSHSIWSNPIEILSQWITISRHKWCSLPISIRIQFKPFYFQSNPCALASHNVHLSSSPPCTPLTNAKMNPPDRYHCPLSSEMELELVLRSYCRLGFCTGANFTTK